MNKDPFVTYIEKNDVSEVEWSRSPKLLEEMNNYFSLHKPDNIRRGDVVALPFIPGQIDILATNGGRYLYDGEKLIEFEKDGYGFDIIPSSFLVEDFGYNPYYWENVMAHSVGKIWLNPSHYTIEKLGEKKSSVYGLLVCYLFKSGQHIFYVTHNGTNKELLTLKMPVLFEITFCDYFFIEENIGWNTHSLLLRDMV